MRRAALLFCLLLPACGRDANPIADVDLLIRVTAPVDAVVPGKAFPLTVVRVWEKALTPSPFRPAALAPLVLELEHTSRREDALRIEETQRFHAYAFTLRDLQVPAVSFSAQTADDQRRVTRSQRLRLRVRPTLDPATPGAPEIPSAPQRERFPPWFWTVYGVAAALLALLGLLWIRRRRNIDTPAHRPVASAASRARERLQALRDGVADPLGDTLAVADVLRDYLASTQAIPARQRTTDEVVAALARTAWPQAAQRNLQRCLADADRTKYGAVVPVDADRRRALEVALDVVAATEGAS